MFSATRGQSKADAEASVPLQHASDSFYLSRSETKQSRMWLVVILNAFLFSFSCLMLWHSTIRTTNLKTTTDRNALLRATSAYSPVLDWVDIPLSIKRMNGTLLPGHPAPIYRQPPSAEVDKAWDRISTRDVVPFDRVDILKMGKDPDDAAKFPDDWFGKDKFIGKIDTFHQIHCLDRIRRSLYWNFDHYYGTEFPPGKPLDNYHTYHVDHCVYVLLQNIQCAANTEVYPHVWMDAQRFPFPDFNINKKCRDFDALLAWQEENSIPVEEVFKVSRRPDSKVHVMSHEFKEAVGWYDDHPDDHVVGGEIA